MKYIFSYTCTRVQAQVPSSNHSTFMEQDHKCMLYTLNRFSDQTETFNVKYELLSSILERFCGLTTGTRCNLVCQLISALAALKKSSRNRPHGMPRASIEPLSHCSCNNFIWSLAEDWQKYEKYTTSSAQRSSTRSPEDVTNSSRRCCIERPLNGLSQICYIYRSLETHFSSHRNVFFFSRENK